MRDFFRIYGTKDYERFQFDVKSRDEALDYVCDFFKQAGVKMMQVDIELEFDAFIANRGVFGYDMDHSSISVDIIEPDEFLSPEEHLKLMDDMLKSTLLTL